MWKELLTLLGLRTLHTPGCTVFFSIKLPFSERADMVFGGPRMMDVARTPGLFPTPWGRAPSGGDGWKLWAACSRPLCGRVTPADWALKMQGAVCPQKVVQRQGDKPAERVSWNLHQ